MGDLVKVKVAVRVNVRINLNPNLNINSRPVDRSANVHDHEISQSDLTISQI